MYEVTCARFCASRSRLPRVPWSTRRSPRSRARTSPGPAEVDGDNGDSVLRKQAQVQARTAVQGGPAAVNNGGKVTTYRKSESDDPYVNVGRNDPCPCGSGKKFKYCHGRNR